ncbi:MAG: HAMP domain-containing histidine kinase [Deltaproteobacteria bacterium]|nr:HAMP domain-containing histidine kinase [Deltaproteobacteria bacterium]
MEPTDQVLVVAPLGRDASVVVQTLAIGGVASVGVTLPELSDRLREGPGAAIVTEEALRPAVLPGLLEALADQPAWSDVPFLLLLSADDTPNTRVGVLAALRSSANVTVLQRPVPAVTLLTTVQSSLRARRRQYQVRDALHRERLAREQAEVASRIKDEFLAAVSHELRTPLSAILLWANLLEAGKTSGEQTLAAVRSIKISAQAQSKLVEDLLDVARTMAGKLRLDLAPHSLTPIVQLALDILAPTAQAKGVRLDTCFEAIDDVVCVDPDRVQQIAWNLLANAIKFTSDGGVVRATISRSGADVILTVADTGDGIDPDLLPHVFERFRQGESRMGPRLSGLGLGLPIVRQLVELQGGTIEVHSDGRETGATFTVRLPAQR